MPFITLNKGTSDAVLGQYLSDEEESKSESDEIVDYDSDYEWVEDNNVEQISDPDI